MSSIQKPTVIIRCTSFAMQCKAPNTGAKRKGVTHIWLVNAPFTVPS